MANSRVAGVMKSGTPGSPTTRGSWVRPMTSCATARSAAGAAVGRTRVQRRRRCAADRLRQPGRQDDAPDVLVSRDAPFLYVDKKRFKCSCRTLEDVRGIDWGVHGRDGRSLPLRAFQIATPSDSAQTLNRALAAGKHLLLTPGVYSLDEPLRIKRPDTVVMGMENVMLTPTKGTAAIEIGDAEGVVLSSVTVDNGTTPSDLLIRVGTRDGEALRAPPPRALGSLRRVISRPDDAQRRVRAHRRHLGRLRQDRPGGQPGRRADRPHVALACRSRRPWHDGVDDQPKRDGAGGQRRRRHRARAVRRAPREDAGAAGTARAAERSSSSASRRTTRRPRRCG